MFKCLLATLALTVAGGAMAADATCMAQVTEEAGGRSQDIVHEKVREGCEGDLRDGVGRKET